MRPIAEYEPMDRERFEREIVAKGEPAVLRGLVADWPVVAARRMATRRLPNSCAPPRPTSRSKPGSAPPEIAGRFGYTDDFSGFNHERKLATVDQLLDLLLRQRGAEQPYSMYAGGVPVRQPSAGR